MLYSLLHVSRCVFELCVILYMPCVVFEYCVVLFMSCVVLGFCVVSYISCVVFGFCVAFTCLVLFCILCRVLNSYCVLQHGPLCKAHANHKCGHIFICIETTQIL